MSPEARERSFDELAKGLANGTMWQIRRPLHATPLDKEEPRIPQRVEKVGLEQMATTNRALKRPKTGRFVADLGRKRASRVFFNSLTPSRTLVNKGTSAHSGDLLGNR
jgi:hypothetical protein